MLDIVYFLRELLFEGSTLLDSEIHKVLQGITDCLFHSLPLLVPQLLHICLRQHVGHTEQRIEPVLRQGDACLVGDGLDLMVVILHQRCVNGRRVHSRVFLYPHTHVHLASDQSLSHHLAHLHLFLTVKRSNTCIQVKLLGIERLHLRMDFLVLVGHDSLAVARH